MIDLKQYLMGRAAQYPLEEDLLYNAGEVVTRANAVMQRFGQWRGVRSGYRPKPVNDRTVGASPNSKHITCEAVDLEDVDREFGKWCLKNQDVLKAYGMYMEDPRDTPTWVHLQIVPPASKVRVFRA